MNSNRQLLTFKQLRQLEPNMFTIKTNNTSVYTFFDVSKNFKCLKTDQKIKIFFKLYYIYFFENQYPHFPLIFLKHET